MDFNTWFALLRKQLDAVMAGNASEAKFLDIVEELARKPELVAGKRISYIMIRFCV
tara:strand:+ start:414 stop:581 length:168 start_codon:yes stop_codon:yes gene_type:complete